MRTVPAASALALLLTTAAGQGGAQTSRIEAAGGAVAVRYTPVPLPGKSLEDIQTRGTVWSMGATEAAVLETDVALVQGRTLIPPGTYRLSTWFKKRGEWQLLVFEGEKNFKRGTPYHALQLQVRELKKPASETLSVAVETRRDLVRLQVSAGRTQLAATLEPLPVVRHKGSLAGQPAEFEFYTWRATMRVQGRLRDLEMVTFGRVRTAGEFGASYDISCQSDGDGIFVVCKDSSLARHKRLLSEKTEALAAAPQDTHLKAQVEALREAVDLQSGLKESVMVAGTVERVEKRAGILGVNPVVDSDGTSFELSFGVRKAKFTLNAGQFKKVSWK